MFGAAAASPRPSPSSVAALADLLAGYVKTGENVRCVRAPQIRDTRVLDDETILFRLRVRDEYVNRLPRACPGLKIQGAFGYVLRGGSDLCR